MGEMGIIAAIAVGAAVAGVVVVYMSDLSRRREMMTRGKGKK
jgi:hypothetical protein